MTLEPLVPLLVLWNKDLWYKKIFPLNLYTLSNNDEFAKTYDEFLLNNSDGSNHVMFKVRFFGNEFVLVHCCSDL